MEISGYSSVFGTQSAEELEKIRRAQRSGSILNKMSAENDTVSFSKEGLRMAAEMKNGADTTEATISLLSGKTTESAYTSTAAARSSSASSVSDTLDAVGTTADDVQLTSLATSTGARLTAETQGNGAESGAGEGKNGGTGESDGSGRASSGSSVKDLQAQIKALSAKLNTVMTSTMPDSSKENAAAPIQKQIQELEGQLRELQAQEAKKA